MQSKWEPGNTHILEIRALLAQQDNTAPIKRAD
jgi:hypothetical protein